jgi:hypothetical protein
MKVNLLTMSVPDEGQYFDYERIWWTLLVFQKGVMHTELDIYIFIVNINNWRLCLNS